MVEGFFIEPCLQKSLDKIKKSVQQKDMDICLVVDGEEGSGKSVFAMQIAYYLDNNLTLDNICMSPEEFKQAIIKAKPFSAIVYDEAYHGLSSRASLSAINKILVSMMMEMRQKNLFVLIVLPTIFLLDRYVVLFRSKALFHIYMNKSRRGYWIGFNRKNKKILYLKGRKTMSYGYPRIYDFKGRFYGKYVVDEEEYRNKKRTSLENEKSFEPESKYKLQRDSLIYFIVKRSGLSYRKVEKELKEENLPENFNISYKQICEIYHKIKEKIQKRDVTSS